MGKGRVGKKKRGEEMGKFKVRTKRKVKMSVSEHTHKAPASFGLMTVVIYG